MIAADSDRHVAVRQVSITELSEVVGPPAKSLSEFVQPEVETLTRRQREVFADTLLAWLPANGNANAVAAALHIHPQTARHRFRQLTRLFGDALHDGDAMFELQIALRAVRARRQAEAG